MIKLRFRKSSTGLGNLLGLLVVMLVCVPIVARLSEPTKHKKAKPVVETVTPKTISKTITITTPPPPPPPPPIAPVLGPTPGSVLNLSNWKLTLPIDTSRPGNPDEIKQPELSRFTLSPYFELNSAKNGVIFRAYIDGVTTSGSKFPRSELREMNSSGRQLASWSDTSGTHSMTIREAITHLPLLKPELVAGQIHDATDDITMVRLEGKQLILEGSGKTLGVLDTNYILGTVFTVKLVAAEGHIKAYYNDVPKVDYSKSGSGYYFKAGCYTQSNKSTDSPGAYGEVVIYDLQVSHS